MINVNKKYKIVKQDTGEVANFRIDTIKNSSGKFGRFEAELIASSGMVLTMFFDEEGNAVGFIAKDNRVSEGFVGIESGLMLQEVEYDQLNIDGVVVPGTQPHSDDLEWFKNIMDKKMYMNRHKGLWNNMSVQYIFSKALAELNELYEAIIKNDNKDQYKLIISETADLSNFMMMLASNINRKYNNISTELQNDRQEEC